MDVYFTGRDRNLPAVREGRMMRRTDVVSGFSRTWLAIVVAAGGLMVFGPNVSTQGRAPKYQVQPLWPRPFQDQSWVLGSITGVTVDGQNHIWVVHRGADSLENNEKGMMLTPPSSSICCKAAPFVLEFDQGGALLTSWGGPGSGYQWPQSPGGLAVDAK